MRPCFKQTDRQTDGQKEGRKDGKKERERKDRKPGLVWWHAVLISTLGRLRQEDCHEFKPAWATD